MLSKNEWLCIKKCAKKRAYILTIEVKTLHNSLIYYI